MGIECMPSIKLKFILMLAFFTIIRANLRMIQNIKENIVLDLLEFKEINNSQIFKNSQTNFTNLISFFISSQNITDDIKTKQTAEEILQSIPKFPRIIIPKTIPPQLRIDVPQSFLGTCTGSKLTEFQLATSGLSPCVALTYFSECQDNSTFTMFGHFDSSHINNIDIYITNVIQRIPISCENGTFTVNIVNPMDNLPGAIQVALNNMHQNVSVINHQAKDLGVDLAIDTRNGKVQKYKDLSLMITDEEVLLEDVFNNIDSNCKLFYIGKERLCRLQHDYKLSFKYDQDLHMFRPPFPNSYLYAFIPSTTPSDSDSCNLKDIDLD